MRLIPAPIRASPALVRAFPFALFILLTALQPYAGHAGRYWIYLLKTVVTAMLLWESRALIQEMRWNFGWEALVVGVGMFLVWINLGDWMQRMGAGSFGIWKVGGPTWNPKETFGSSSASAWSFIAVRVLGSTLVVPPMEEVFYRSFVYRFLVRSEFQTVPLGYFAWMPFFATSVVFGCEHREWLAGIVCGLAYQGLVCWKKRLGDAITAHAITNALLAYWVIQRGQWQFW